MNKLYLLINLLVLLGPLTLSFDKKVAFFRTWKPLFLSILVMMLIYIPWDMFFTDQGIWGFNQNYLTGLTIGNLPVEEVLFFLTVPYACTFIYACVKAYLKVQLSTLVKVVILSLVVVILLGLMIIGHQQNYSFYTSLCTLITLLVFLILHKGNAFWGNFLVSYAIAMLPFFIVNGILTGSSIEQEVVWYNPQHIFNVRMFTIPIEDSIYNFGMLLLTIGSYELAKK